MKSAKELGILLYEHVVVAGRKLLRSGPGKCKKQDFHYDYSKKVVGKCSIPLKSMIVAIEDNTRLCVRGWEDIVLQRGDYVIFGSRFEHAGSAYAATHFRLFAYIGPQGFKVGNQTDYGKGWHVRDDD